jgi:hypothetical protein
MVSMKCNVEFAFALGPRKTTENLDRVGRSQDLPDANLLLASSPALNPRTLLYTYSVKCIFIIAQRYYDVELHGNCA